MVKIRTLEELKQSQSVIVAEEDLIAFIFYTNFDNFLLGMYEKILVAPDVYDYFLKTLSIDDLKVFRKKYTKIEFNASKAAINSIVEQEGIITKNEAFSMLCAMMDKHDVLMDYEKKADIFAAHSINVIRLSELMSSIFMSDAEGQR